MTHLSKRLSALSLAFFSLLFSAAGGYFSSAAAASLFPRGVQRLHFAPGQKRIVIYGFISPRRRSLAYTLYARRGGHLKITLRDLVPPGRRPYDVLVTTYHITFPSGKQYGLKGYDPFDGRLTETGVYRLHVGVNLMASNRRSGRFHLTLSR